LTTTSGRIKNLNKKWNCIGGERRFYLEENDQRGLATWSNIWPLNYPFLKNKSFLSGILAWASETTLPIQFDETVYILPILSDKAGNLEIPVLEDWA
jgi:zinc protease